MLKDKIDVSFEYNTSSEEFIYDNVMKATMDSMWVCYHTERGKKYLENKGISVGNTNERVLVEHDLAKKAWNDLAKPLEDGTYLMGLYGGFYYKDKSHKEHM